MLDSIIQNITYVDLKNMTGFTIQAFTDVPELQLLVFLIFLAGFLIIVFGNVTIFTVILSDSNLHTPMYIFFLKLSLIDISCALNILPNVLYILITQHKTISFVGCITQMYIFISLTCNEIFLLGAMAYDRYVAICHPLHYSNLMSYRHCTLLLIVPWLLGFINPIAHAVFISRLSFCSSHLIDHFFCDVTPLLKISCSDTYSIELITYLDGMLVFFPDFLLTITSYVFIISTILKIQSAEGRQKAFSTCTSHLTCVIMFFGTIMCLYIRPVSSYSPKQDKFFSLLYVVLVPMLNPLIYSLKNQDVKHSLRKLKSRIVWIVR